jgi:hypothetical protein
VLGFLGMCVVGILLMVLLTSWLWIPLVMMNLPLLAILFFVTKWTGLDGKILDMYYKLYDFMFYRSEWLRKTLW